ncbi:hypothetical protein [Deminuibacter soli]|uniref:Universal stress protein n=1 Tax=Deminuibacter soli TaxID=2291815 RepID=A0A3E1NFU9_9BACT|nr:hypothetical protein [Deminuibacter soli]RFM26839.1 hypothetical protein DXN05_17780 [Deminuibacter soli]
MPTTLAIFNGTCFPPDVINTAIKSVQGADSTLIMLFLSDVNVEGVGYVFPSDMNAVENQSERSDVVNDNDQIIADNMKLAEDMCLTEKVRFEIRRLKKPAKAAIYALLKEADFVIMEQFEQPPRYGVSNVNLHKLIDQSGAKITWIKKE